MMPILKKPLVVAVTGHRWNRMDREREPELLKALQACLSAIDAGATGTDTVQLMTGMAEGADQLAAMAMPHHWHLWAVLPLPRQVYEDHLLVQGTGDRAETVRRLREALARAGTRVDALDLGSADAGYMGIQSAILEQADLLVALWDGGASAGAGGTADTVAKALARGMPVLWIASQGPDDLAIRRVTAVAASGVASATRIDMKQIAEVIARRSQD